MSERNRRPLRKNGTISLSATVKLGKTVVFAFFGRFITNEKFEGKTKLSACCASQDCSIAVVFGDIGWVSHAMKTVPIDRQNLVFC